MANIKPFLNKIRTAIYGKEVRGSLADGLEAVNKETENATVLSKSTEHRQTSLEQQFDDQIKNMTLADPSSAEMVAGRTNTETGESFPTIGRRMDEENGRINLRIEDTLNKIDALNGVNPLTFGAHADGVTLDDEAFFLAKEYAIESGINKIVVTKGNYLLDNLIVLDGLDGFDLEIKQGARIFTKKHGWGVIEIVRSKNIMIHGTGIIEGPYTVVDKNHNSTKGGGEKHVVTNTGYQWGAYRNDSLKVFGPFNGGYIGNSGIGILIHDGCENVHVLDLEIAGFNYSGVHVGFRGDKRDQQLNFSKNIKIKCYIHDCYNSGIEYYSVDGIDTSGSLVEDIGHPEALPSDPVIDPGYGIASTAVSDVNYQSKNAKVEFCTIRRTKRRGIDTHASDGLSILGCLIEDTLVNGIGLTGASALKKNVDVMFNTLIRCGIADDPASSVDLKAGITNKYQFANISKNRLVDCGTNTVIYTESNFVKVDDNIIESSMESGKSEYHTGIDFANGTGVSAKGNIIKGKFKRGFRFRKGVKGHFDVNEVDISWSTETQQVIFENSSMTIGNNNLNRIVSSLGNSINKLKQFTFLLEYSTSRTLPKATLLDGDTSIPYEIITSGTGATLRFDVGVDISEKSHALLSLTGTKGANVAYITTYKNFVNSRYLDISISPRRIDNTVITSNHADVNGLNLILNINLAGIV